MASLSWLARGLAARMSRKGPAVPRTEPRRDDGGQPRLEAAIAGRPTEEGFARARGGSSPVEGRPPPEKPSDGRVDSTPKQFSADVAKEAIQLPLANVLESVPLLFLAGDAEKLVDSAKARSETVGVPLEQVLAQLPSGRIEFRFDDLKSQIPGEFLTEESRGEEQGEVPILLDLAQVVRHLPSSALSRRDDQMEVPGTQDKDLPELVVRPDKKPKEAPLRETARVAMAASSMPILPGSALGLQSPAQEPTGPDAPRENIEPVTEVILPGAAPQAEPGAEPVGPAEPLFVRRTGTPKPLFKSRQPAEVGKRAPTPEAEVPMESETVPPTPMAAQSASPPLSKGTEPMRPTPIVARRPRPPIITPPRPLFKAPPEKEKPIATGAPKSGPELQRDTASQPVGPAVEVAKKPIGAKLSLDIGSVPVLGVVPTSRPPSVMHFRPAQKATPPAPTPTPIRVAVPTAPGEPMASEERAMATRALARWLGVGSERDVFIREIPEILTQLPGVAGAIISDNEALTVARQLPAGIPEEAISSSASLLYKRLRHAANELGGGFTNQTLVGLGQWTLVITFEAPFFLTTVHPSLFVPPRLTRRMRKIARALARLEAARPVG